MQVGIDSYSYHRRYGEVRTGEVPSAPRRGPRSPVRSFATPRRSAADVVFLETCYLPEPEAIDAAMLADAGPDVRVGFSWGHPWPAGRVPRPRWRPLVGRGASSSCAGSMPPPGSGRRPAHHGRQPGLPRRRAGRGPRRAARRADPSRRRSSRGARHPARPSRTTATCASRDILELFERVDRPATLGVCLDNVNLLRVGDDMADGTRGARALHATGPAQGPPRRRPDRARRPGLHGPRRGRRGPRRPDRDPRRRRLRRPGLRRARVARRAATSTSSR